MKKILKRVLITLAAVAGGAGLVVGGLLLYRNLSKKPVAVYQMDNFAMTDYWGDTSETYGSVETRNIQTIYTSSTQIITEVLVTQGQYVQVGDPLLRVDTTLTDIELERQRIKLEQTRLDYEKAQKELAVINTYVPYYPPTPEPEPEPEELPAEQLPKLLGGQGTEERPYIFLWNEDQWCSEDFINAFLAKPTPVSPEESAGESLTSSEQTEESGAAAEEADSQPVISQPEDSQPEASGPQPENPDEPQKPEFFAEAYVVFEVRQYDNSKGDLLENWMIRFVREFDGTISFRKMVPTENYDGKEIIIPEDDDDGGTWYGPMYTWSEIQEMKADKQKEIRDLELQIRLEEVKYEKLRMEMETGLVTATVEGVVKLLNDEEYARMTGEPLCVISAGGGYYITGTLSELELSTVKVGQTVTVTSWMNYMAVDGTIVEISEYPVDNNNGWSAGNTNVSYYPFTVFVSEDANLQANEYVSIMYSAQENSSGLYLQNMFIRSEGSRYFVYVAGEDGRLERRDVTVGKSLWGSYMEVLSGVTMEEKIAFPYGKDVAEGAPTEEKSVEDFYNLGY